MGGSERRTYAPTVRGAAMASADGINRVADALFQVAKAQRALAVQACRQANYSEALLEVHKVQLGVTKALEEELLRKSGKIPEYEPFVVEDDESS